MLQFTEISQSIYDFEIIEGQVEREEDGTQGYAAATTAAVLKESSSIEVGEDSGVS